jgi:hypothetical protein
MQALKAKFEQTSTDLANPIFPEVPFLASRPCFMRLLDSLDSDIKMVSSFLNSKRAIMSAFYERLGALVAETRANLAQPLAPPVHEVKDEGAPALDEVMMDTSSMSLAVNLKDPSACADLTIICTKEPKRKVKHEVKVERDEELSFGSATQKSNQKREKSRSRSPQSCEIQPRFSSAQREH